MNKAFIVLFLFLLMGCQQKSHQDVIEFIENGKRQPAPNIEPLPAFIPYKPHEYNADGLRSPFEPPAVIEQKQIAATSNVKPDFNRTKHPLEDYDFSALQMVGSVKKQGVLWALVQDPEGSIERVKTGDYLGRNHGRITDMSELQIDVIEIVPNGDQSWLERPNAIRLRGVQNAN